MSDKRCADCRFWAEMLARSEGNGIEAVCLSVDGPRASQWVGEQESCGRFAKDYGHAIDEPGLPRAWHAEMDAG